MKVASVPDIKVSIAEVCEVRGCGLDAVELLSLAVSAAESLPPCPNGTVFDTENVFISSKGNVQIVTVPQTSVHISFIPPEWAKGDYDEGAAAVYCMGAVMRAAGAEQASDVDLFSLVNILTVAMVGTRPTAHRMGLMARNQLKGRDAKSILIGIYEEIMGDEEGNNLDDGDYLIDENGEDLVLQPVVRNFDLINEDEEKESRDATASTSSYHSSEKGTSHCIDVHMEITEGNKNADVLLPVSSPRLVNSLFHDSFDTLGSPVGNSTRFNETYIEEQTLDISFNKSFDNNFIDLTSISNPRSKANCESNNTNLTPFDEDENDHGGTLSGRDPFEDEMPFITEQNKISQKSLFDTKEIQDIPTAEFRDFSYLTHQSNIHRLSSSDDEIVQVVVDDDVEPKRSTKSRYFDEIILREESSKNLGIWSTTGESGLQKPPNLCAPISQNGENISYPHQSCKISNKNKLIEEASELEDETDNRKHVDAIVITDTHEPEMKSMHTTEYEETPIDTAFDDAIKERLNSQGIEKTIVDPVPPDNNNSLPFKRRNSLVPSRVSGRKSMRGKRKTRAVPEFYDHSRHPSIRLKAPSAKKKKMTLLRIEQAEVWVELLNGQRIEVSCRTDTLARDIFSLVVQHMNINEHVFFGLSVMRDGEHYFLEEHQRLEKFAPPGWKNYQKNSIRTQYVLYLRFRFYPQILDFIKTSVTMHELYLQMRRDIIEDRLQPKRHTALELAALALQAEFGNRPPVAVTDYFDNQHYLTKRFCSKEDPNRLQSMLADLHGQNSGIQSIEAEQKFIQICQRHGDFGAHIHRVFRSKPSVAHGVSPFDPETSAILWIAIMPRGIAVYEEQLTSVRELLAEHLWQDTQTLQFDKKKFIIVSGKGMEPMESVFYTDHHSKSSYFVKFSASQHRFMMRMRHWKSTLKHETTIQRMPDVCVEGREPFPIVGVVVSHDEESPLGSTASLFAKMPMTLPVVASRPLVHDLSTTGRDREVLEKLNNDETISNSLSERFEVATRSESEISNKLMVVRFEVTLVKDPSSGLGLTLVDGNLNEVRGVYVKSVADNGAGLRAGLCVGDRLLAVDGNSLENGDRHKAVELVQKSGRTVRMEIARLDGVARHERSVSRGSDAVKKNSSPLAPFALTLPTTQKGVSRTPPAPRRTANRRQRAVSDFGAIGDTLPTLDSENVIDIKAISGLHLDESDEERGEYRLPTTSMYSFDDYDDERASSPSNEKSGDFSSVKSSRGNISIADSRRKYRNARKSTLDWAEGLEELGEEQEQDGFVNVTLKRNSVGSLGVQIASVGGRVCVKQLTAEPATSHPDIHVGDELLCVNGDLVSNKTHQEVVAMLRNGGSVVTLGLKRNQEEKPPNIVTAVLEKRPSGSLGLSLAKRTGSDGIFIRMISADSAASCEGSLRVGDRLISLDGHSVDGLSPTTILERLKAINGPVTLSVSRDSQ